jgi:hypothetical protein
MVEPALGRPGHDEVLQAVDAVPELGELVSVEPLEGQELVPGGAESVHDFALG